MGNPHLFWTEWKGGQAPFNSDSRLMHGTVSGTNLVTQEIGNVDLTKYVLTNDTYNIGAVANRLSNSRMVLG